MKTSELKRELKKAGCYLLRHGSNHDIWESPITGLTTSVPRHGSAEIPKGTLAMIRRKLLGVR
ncbi:YcfA-like protein [Prevotella disiens FB035-09AN]|uniref:YcfA-like protein n=1 Tax=Prevotella disiens FB035-09AN TaxID=866771 RepID=E1KNX5_9BACT|nr:type II toxin-antitoxin system HicA family toxin [Prevotella disiens]EFL46742.1 YcfA-like protein [Prevotella disiens FB035-09AN]